MRRDGRGSDDWWRDRVAIITGASSGIGRATAEALLHRGCRVGLIARSAERLDAIASPWGDRALPLPADVTDRVHLQQQIHLAINRWGRVDLLVHSAGILKIQLCDELDDALRSMVETNTLGAAWATQAVVPAMRQARFGRIVYLSSLSGHVAPVGYAGYAISKWGLRALAQSLRCELRGSGIQISLVSPYYVDTPMLEDERMAGPLPGFDSKAIVTPAAVAEAILRVASTGRSEAILAPVTLRLGVLLGKFLTNVEDLVLARQGRRLVEHRRKNSG